MYILSLENKCKLRGNFALPINCFDLHSLKEVEFFCFASLQLHTDWFMHDRNNFTVIYSVFSSNVIHRKGLKFHRYDIHVVIKHRG